MNFTKILDNINISGIENAKINKNTHLKLFYMVINIDLVIDGTISKHRYIGIYI